MQVFQLKETSMAGQVLLETVARRGNSTILPEVSIQLPENRAKQILDAFALVQSIAELNNNSIDLICSLNTKETITALRDAAKKVIEK